MFWTFSQQFGVQLVNIIAQLILARLLLPEAFGLIALIQIFLAIGQAISDGGMTASLIRSKNLEQSDYSTVFFINISTSIFLYFLFYFSAPLIAIFFHLPEMILIVRVYCIFFIIQALVGVHSAKLTIAMNFKLQAYIQIFASLLGGIVGILLAFDGWGVWSLVWMRLSTTIVFMILLWFRLDWRPDFILDYKKLKYHFQFGYKLTLSSLLTSIYYNLYNVIIGRFFSVSQLGYYNQADTLKMFPVQNLTMVIQKVTFPVFSTLQNNDEQLKSIFQRITLMVFYVICPIMIFLCLVAEPLIKILLTEKWLPAVPYFQILSLFAIVYPISIYTLNIILAKGKSGLHFKLEVIKKLGSSIFLFLIIPFGMYGVVYAAALSMLVHAIVNCYVGGKLIRYPLIEQFKNVFPILIMGGVSGMITYFSYNFLFHGLDINNSWIFIGGNFFIFFFIYMVFSIIINSRSLNEIKLIFYEIKNMRYSNIDKNETN